MDACVYVVDDEPLVRESLAWLLESVHVKTQLFANSDEFLAVFKAGLVGCGVLDVRMQGMNGMDLYHLIQQIDPHFPVIIVTAHADVPLAIRAMKQGAFDLIEKPYNDQYMLERVQMAIQQNARSHQNAELQQGLSERFQHLSTREQQVLEKVLQGKPNKLIADELFISIKTVEAHRSNLMQKLEVKTLAELIRLSISAGKG